MRAPRLFSCCLCILALSGCAVRTEHMQEPIEPDTDAPQTGQPATVESGNALPLLNRLEGTPLSASGSMRFLTTGVLEFGEADAPLTLTVFTEYHCTYCNQFYREFLPRLRQDFMDAGKLRIRFVPFAINKYPYSEDVIRGFLCASMMGEGLRMQNLLVTRQEKDRLSTKDYWKELGMDAGSLQECLGNQTIFSIREMQNTVAKDLGVTLVPTFFLNTEKRVGLPDYIDLRGWIRSKLGRS